MVEIVQLIFESLFELFKRPENAYVFALFLIVFGLIVFAFAVYLFLRRYQPLKKLNKLLEANIKREDFAANFHEIDAAFYDTSNKWGHNLSHAWAELKESLVHENEEKVVWNTARPHNYIDAHDIRGPRVLSSFPNIFVGLGLVFTFLGLAASLQGISIDGDVASMQKGLQNVLSAASVKFTASITGLVLSIFLGSFIRFAAHALDNQIELVNEYLERGMRFVTSEELAYKQLQQLTEQTAQLQNFNATLAADIGSEIEKKLAALFNDGLGKAVSDGAGAKIEEVAGTLTEVNKSLLEVTNKISDSGNVFGSQIEGMSQQINEMMKTTAEGSQENLNKFMQNLEGTMEGLTSKIDKQFSNSTKNITKDISEASTNLASSIAGAGQEFSDVLSESSKLMHSAVSDLNGQMDTFSTSINSFDGTIKSHLMNIQTSTSGLQKLIEGFSTNIQEIQKAGEPFSESAKQLKTSGEALEKSTELLNGLKENMSSYIETMSSASEQTAASWEEYRSRFEGVDESLENIFKQFADSISANQEQIATFSKELDQSFTKATKTLSGAIDELEGTVSDLSAKSV